MAIKTVSSVQGQIEYRSRIENWRILWVTSPGDSTALSQYSYIRPAELRNLHSQTLILEMLVQFIYILVKIYENKAEYLFYIAERWKYWAVKFVNVNIKVG